MVTVTLPLPNRGLHPNSRTHWAAKARLTRTTRTAAHLQTLAAIRNRELRIDRPLACRMTWYFPTRRTRDSDNLLAWMKANLDGIADAIGLDDSGFVHWPAIIGYDRERPRVEVCLWHPSEGQGAPACMPSPSSEPTRP